MRAAHAASGPHGPSAHSSSGDEHMCINRVPRLMVLAVLLAACDSDELAGPGSARPMLDDTQCMPGEPCGTQNTLNVDVWSKGVFWGDDGKQWAELYSGTWVTNGGAYSTVTAIGYRATCTGPMVEFARRTATRYTAGKVEALIRSPNYPQAENWRWMVKGTHNVVPDPGYIGGGTYSTSFTTICY
jgi:hypothetical protein